MDYKDFELCPEQENFVTLQTEDGQEELCQIIFSIKSEKLNKKYVIFSRAADIEKSMSEDSEEEQIEVGAAEYQETEDGSGKLVAIETEEEWELIEEALAAFDEDYEAVEDDHCCCHEHCHCDEDGSCYCEDDDCECDCESHCDCCHEEEK